MSIRETRRLITIAIVVLVLIDLAAIGVLFSPMGSSPERKEAELRQLQTQFKQKEREIGPSRGMDKKIAAATVDITDFYKQRLPGQYSQIDEALGKSAQTAGVQLQNVTYKPDKKPIEDLQRVDISLTISGPYVNDVKFINSMERDKVFFVINSVSLAGGEKGVALSVKAETYFRVGAA